MINTKTVYSTDRFSAPVRANRRLPDRLFTSSRRNAGWITQDLEEIGLQCVTSRDANGHFIVTAMGDIKRAVEENGSRHMAKTIALWWPDLSGVTMINFDATMIAEARDAAWLAYKDWVRSACAILGEDEETFDPQQLDPSDIEMLEEKVGELMPPAKLPLSAAIYPDDGRGRGSAWAIVK